MYNMALACQRLCAPYAAAGSRQQQRYIAPHMARAYVYMRLSIAALLLGVMLLSRAALRAAPPLCAHIAHLAARVIA